MKDEVIRGEKEKLKNILEAYKEVIKYTELSIEALPKMYRDNPDLLNSLLSQAELKLINLNKGLDKPYFARIDFTDSEGGKKEVCYIGKVGVLDSDNKIITVDWRTPIASLYYDSNVGPASYEAPKGIIKGTLDLKRQIEIEKGNLISVQDVDAVSNDELLKPYLGVNADNRLKNIVSSIQCEQNAVIRENLRKNIIVQGVAGSGKTTVALHRIAYLVYNNRDKINPDQYMVIGPNKFFIDYISSVLPDLDVSNVPQLTFEELALDFVGEKFEINDSSHKIISSMTNSPEKSVDKYKTSMRYKQAIDRFIAYFEQILIPDKDFEIRGFTVLNSETIKEIYDNMTGYATDDLQSKVDRCILLVSKKIEENREKLISRLGNFTYEEFQKHKNDSKAVIKIKKNFEAIKRELENNCYQSLKKYFSRVNTKIMTLYNTFVSHIEEYTQDNIGYLKKVTLGNIKNRKVDFEDLAALIYLKERLKGTSIYRKYRHTVIDEAQDFGEFNFYVLNKIMNNGTFSIFGDLAQSIYSYRSVDNWDDVVKNSFDNQCEVLELLKSYRTTVEIMKAANNITNHIGLNSATPVIRHGDEVSVSRINEGSKIEHIYNKILEFKAKGYNSIAIISKTDAEAGKVNLELRKLGIDINHVSSSNEPYEGGICTIPSYLSKGLEFDAVILDNVSKKNYSSTNKIDMQLLYVSMTRPLHELDLIYDGEITMPLQSLLMKKDGLMIK